MPKAQIGLGVLGIPSVLSSVGLIPGVMLLLVIGGIATWSDYIVGVFKMRHRHVYGIDDVGEMLFGPIGREIFAVALCLCMSVPAYLSFVNALLILPISPHLYLGFCHA